MKELVEQIKAEFEAFVKEADAQVEKGNKAAGTRARKSALALTSVLAAVLLAACARRKEIKRP